MKKRIEITFFIILGIILLIGAIFNNHVIAEGENYSSYSYDYYNLEGIFEYSRQGSLLYPFGLGGYSLRGFPTQQYVLANYNPNPYSLGSYLYRYFGGGYPTQNYVLANYNPNPYSLGSYLYRYFGGGFPMQNYVLANYGFSGFGGFY